MKACTDFEFLDSYWTEAKRIAKDIKENLPKIQSKVKTENHGNSATLEALADKLHNMIFKGDAENVKPFITRILTKGIKKQSRPRVFDAEFLGHADFRWNFGEVYTLTYEELERVKQYFKLDHIEIKKEDDEDI